jgi:hypothetical protein
MESPLRLFAAAMVKKVWALLSCAAFTGIGVYAAAKNKGNAWQVGASAVIAAGSFIVAAFQTWKDEYGRYTAEVAKNQKPDIQGDVAVCGYGIEEEGHENGQWSVDSEVIFQLTLCNHRAVTTTLEDIECDGSALIPPVVFNPALSRPRTGFPVGVEMPRGIGRCFDVTVSATINGVRWADVHPIDLRPLKFHVIDAFGQKHLLRVRKGDRLFPHRP